MEGFCFPPRLFSPRPLWRLWPPLGFARPPASFRTPKPVLSGYGFTALPHSPACLPVRTGGREGVPPPGLSRRRRSTPPPHGSPSSARPQPTRAPPPPLSGSRPSHRPQPGLPAALEAVPPASGKGVGGCHLLSRGRGGLRWGGVCRFLPPALTLPCHGGPGPDLRPELVLAAVPRNKVRLPSPSHRPSGWGLWRRPAPGRHRSASRWSPCRGEWTSPSAHADSGGGGGGVLLAGVGGGGWVWGQGEAGVRQRRGRGRVSAVVRREGRPLPEGLGNPFSLLPGPGVEAGCPAACAAW